MHCQDVDIYLKEIVVSVTKLELEKSLPPNIFVAVKGG